VKGDLLQGVLGLKITFMCSTKKERSHKSEPVFHVPADNLRNNIQTLS